MQSAKCSFSGLSPLLSTLLYASVEGGSTLVEVSVDFGEWTLTVADNGSEDATENADRMQNMRWIAQVSECRLENGGESHRVAAIGEEHSGLPQTPESRVSKSKVKLDSKSKSELTKVKLSELFATQSWLRAESSESLAAQCRDTVRRFARLFAGQCAFELRLAPQRSAVDSECVSQRQTALNEATDECEQSADSSVIYHSPFVPKSAAFDEFVFMEDLKHADKCVKTGKVLTKTESKSKKRKFSDMRVSDEKSKPKTASVWQSLDLKSVFVGGESLAAASGCLLSGGSLPIARVQCSVRLTKAALSGLRLVAFGQMDNAWILCRTESCLFACDQHAADERIRLERMTALLIDVGKGPPKTQRIAQRTLDCPLTVCLTEAAQSAVIRKRKLLTNWAFAVSAANGSATVWRVPVVLGTAVCTTQAECRELMQELSDGVPLSEWQFVPQCVARMLRSKACHSAVRFGDRLSKRKMKALLRNLANCSDPFHCAHGRPTLFPLATLDSLPSSNPMQY